MNDQHEKPDKRPKRVRRGRAEKTEAMAGESTLLPGFGAVTPRQRPEDFAAVRAFECGVAKEASRWLR